MSQNVTEPDPQESNEKISSREMWAQRSPSQEQVAEDAAQSRDREEPKRREAADDTVQLKVFRYDPDVKSKQEPRFDEFLVPFEKGLTVLDALIYARDTYDSSLTFRHSCRQAICGSDAFFINGTQRLGCKTQIEGLDEPVRIEPLPHQEVIKDLVVDMDHFYDQMHTVEPYLQNEETLDPADLEEQRQSREN